MTPELLATALLATLAPIMKKGAESLAGTMLKDGWDQVKKCLSGQAGEDAARVEAGEPATPALQAEIATVLEKDPRLAAEIGREVERHRVQADGGVAVGTAQAEKMIIMRDAKTISF